MSGSDAIQTPPFLASILRHIGPEGFINYVEKGSVEVLWESLIQELLKEPCLPSLFLPIYIGSGQTISALPSKIKALAGTILGTNTA